MLDISSCVRQDLVKLIPSALFKDVSCFTFYDNHPCDNINIDVIVCTLRNEIIELSQRNTVYTCLVNTSMKVLNVNIHRSNAGTLYYLLSTAKELFIYCRKINISLLKKILNVDKFTLDDLQCEGHACLKVWCNGDVVPIIFDDNFDEISENGSSMTLENTNEYSLPVINLLKCKLNEARYLLAHNEEGYNKIVSLRQSAAYAIYQKMYPEVKEAAFKKPLKEMIGCLKIKINAPWVKICNNKIVAVIDVFNDANESLKNIEVFIHNTEKTIIEYTTKLFENCKEAPYWQEISSNMVRENSTASIALVIDIKELQHNVQDTIELNGIILYNLNGKQRILPFDDMKLSPLQVIDEKFDVFTSMCFEKDVLALIASSIQTDLTITHIPSDNQTETLSWDMLRQHLNMDTVLNNKNMIIYKSFPYHTLNGVMILFNSKSTDFNNCKIAVYSRSEWQVLTLLHLIYDKVPFRLLATPLNVAITGITDTLQQYVKVHNKEEENRNIFLYGESLIKQISLILKYLDVCIMKMGHSTNESDMNMLGSKINITIVEKCDKDLFINNIKEEMLNGIRSLNNVSINTMYGRRREFRPM